MPKPGYRSRSKKKDKKKLPGSRIQVHYKPGAGKEGLCKMCKKPLSGVPHASQSLLRTLSKSKKRIQRPYGGELCHSCLMQALRRAARTA